MTYKQIEASREVRLWIGQVIVPAGMAAASLMAIPGVRDAAAKKAKQVKGSIRNKIDKIKNK